MRARMGDNVLVKKNRIFKISQNLPILHPGAPWAGAMPTATRGSRKRAASAPAVPRARAKKKPSATRRRATASPDDVGAASLPVDVVRPVPIPQPTPAEKPEICAAGGGATSPAPTPAPALLHVESEDTMQMDAEEEVVADAEAETDGGHAGKNDGQLCFCVFLVLSATLLVAKCERAREGVVEKESSRVCILCILLA